MNPLPVRVRLRVREERMAAIVVPVPVGTRGHTVGTEWPVTMGVSRVVSGEKPQVRG